jgi:hypothetical protein
VPPLERTHRACSLTPANTQPDNRAGNASGYITQFYVVPVRSFTLFPKAAQAPNQDQVWNPTLLENRLDGNNQFAPFAL